MGLYELLLRILTSFKIQFRVAKVPLFLANRSCILLGGDVHPSALWLLCVSIQETSFNSWNAPLRFLVLQKIETYLLTPQICGQSPLLEYRHNPKQISIPRDWYLFKIENDLVLFGQLS